MANVIYVPFQTVEPRATPPEDYQHIQATPQAFGAQIGQAEERLGAGATSAARFYGEVAADDATNQYMTESRKILHGDPNSVGPDGQPDRGIFGLRGKAAADAWPSVEQRLEQLRTQVGGGLATPASRLQFDTETRRFQYYMGLEIGRHADAEYNNWYGEVEKNSIDVARSNLNDAISRNDVEGANHAAADLVGAYTRRASRLSGNDETALKAAQIDGQKDAATTRVLALAPHDPQAAQQALDAARGMIGAQEYERLHDHLKPQIRDAQAQQLVFGTPTPSGGSVAAQNLANNNPGNIKAPGGGWASYPTHEAGIGAIGDWLQRAQTDHGLTTIRQLIDDPTHGYAPSADPGNAGKHLPEAAAQIVGISPDARIDMNDAATRGKMVQAILTQEQGAQYAQHEQQYGGATPPAAVPGLMPKINQILASGADPQTKEAAIRLAETTYSAQWADQQRAHELQQRAVKDASDGREKEIIADAFSGQPKITAQQISSDPSLSPEARLRMISMVARSEKPDPPAKVSQATRTELFQDMRLPTGDPNRISDMGPINDAMAQGKLSRADYGFLEKQITDFRSNEGERLKDQMSKFLTGYKGFITQSNDLMGAHDAVGDANYYMFETFVADKVAQYKRDGKDPFSLFTRGPDFLGTPEVILQYQQHAQESIKGKIEAATGVKSPPQWPGMPAGAPTAIPRQPGETIDQFMKRIGGAAAAIPPANAAPAVPPLAPPIETLRP